MFYLQADAAFSGNLIFMLAMLAVVYFFMIRPQSKRNKEQQKFITDLERGTEVVTNSGMIGRINKIEGNVVTLQVDQKTFVRVLRSAISKEMTDNLDSKES